MFMASPWYFVGVLLSPQLLKVIEVRLPPTAAANLARPRAAAAYCIAVQHATDSSPRHPHQPTLAVAAPPARRQGGSGNVCGPAPILPRPVILLVAGLPGRARTRSEELLPRCEGPLLPSPSACSSRLLRYRRRLFASLPPSGSGSPWQYIRAHVLHVSAHMQKGSAKPCNCTK